jgi:hypothetical protein
VSDDGEGVHALQREEGEDDGEEEVQADAHVAARVLNIHDLLGTYLFNCSYKDVEWSTR